MSLSVNVNVSEDASIFAALDLAEDELDDAAEDVDIVLSFEQGCPYEDDIRKEVSRWLVERMWPWKVVGADTSDDTCSVMLAPRTFEEVTYSV